LLLLRALDEQLHGFGTPHRFRVRGSVGQRQRGQRIGLLTRYAQWLTTGGHNRRFRSRMKHGVGEARTSLQQVLAIVQQQQQLAALDSRAQGLQDRLPRRLMHAQHLGHRARHQRRIGQRGQVHEPDTVAVGGHHLSRRLQREPSLADAADTNKSQQACAGQQPLDVDQLPFAADERRQRLRQIRALAISRRVLRQVSTQLGDRPDKAIASPCQRLDPALASRCLRKHASDCCDLNGQIAFFHNNARPRRVDDAVFLNKLVASLHECGQHCHRTRA
jgi:hypothetical protein